VIVCGQYHTEMSRCRFRAQKDAVTAPRVEELGLRQEWLDVSHRLKSDARNLASLCNPVS
jgi:hypothetical protein